MIATYRVLSAALSYPSETLQSAAGEMADALKADRLLPPAHIAAVSALIGDIAKTDLLDAQSQYVELFDRTKSLSLHLFEHVHGESRDRGQAMVSLLARYQEAGLDVVGAELPDFIPLFLEFLSILPANDARAMLAEPAHILAALAERLRARKSHYATLFEALVALSQVKPDAETLALLREEKIEDPSDLVALDAAWEETEVRFGPGDAATDNCPRVSDMLKKMDAPVEKSASHTLPGLPS